MNTRSTAITNSAVASEEELSIALAENPINDDDIDFLFNEAFEGDSSDEVVVQKPTIDGSMSLNAFLASGIDPTTTMDEAAPPTLPSTLLLRKAEQD